MFVRMSVCPTTPPTLMRLGQQIIHQNKHYVSVLNVPNKVLYGKLPSITSIIEERRLRFSGHCFRSKHEVVHQLILWEPKHGSRSVGGQLRTYIDQLESDTGIPRENLANAMEDREGWRKRVMAKKVRLRSM